MRRGVAIAWLFASACTADFLIGDGGTGDSGAGSSSGTGSPSTSLDSGATSGAADEGGTMAPTSSGDSATTSAQTSDPGTTTAPGTSGDATLEGGVDATLEGGVETTTETTGGDTAGGVADCPESTIEGCEDLPACDLYMVGEMQVCWADPCQPDASSTCDGHGMDGCAMAPLCHWDADAAACVPAACGDILTMTGCLEEPACRWFEMMCSPIECPPCGDYGQEMCTATEGCTWHELAAVCVTD